ncbi:hypothetical protein ACFX1Q_036500 [Malus domestica]
MAHLKNFHQFKIKPQRPLKNFHQFKIRPRRPLKKVFIVYHPFIPKNQESPFHSSFIVLPRSNLDGPWINNHPPSRSSPDGPFEELPPIQDQAPTALEESVHRLSSVHPEESRKPSSFFVHRSSKIKPRRPLDQQSSTFKIKPQQPL